MKTQLKLIFILVLIFIFFGCQGDANLDVAEDRTTTSNSITLVPGKTDISATTQGSDSLNQTTVLSTTTVASSSTDSSQSVTDTTSSSSAQGDFDKDGTPDSVDNDDDNDKIPDIQDCSPLNKDRLASWDTDKDKKCDSTDSPFYMNEWVSVPSNKPDGLIHYNAINTYPVKLHPFRITKYEVSITDYNRCVAAGKCTSTEVADEDLPVYNVTWQNARTYCNWVGGDLSTQVQWEYAATSGDGRYYPWEDINQFFGAFLGVESLLPVNSEGGESPFGLPNMLGNVFEWQRDSCRDDFFACLTSAECSLGVKVSDMDPWDRWDNGDWKCARGFSVMNYWDQISATYEFPLTISYAIDANTLADSYPIDYNGAIGMRCVLE